MENLVWFITKSISILCFIHRNLTNAEWSTECFVMHSKLRSEFFKSRTILSLGDIGKFAFIFTICFLKHQQIHCSNPSISLFLHDCDRSIRLYVSLQHWKYVSAKTTGLFISSNFSGRSDSRKIIQIVILWESTSIQDSLGKKFSNGKDDLDNPFNLSQA